MNDHSNFSMALVAFGLFLTALLPAIKQAKQDLRDLHSNVATVYVSPNPNDPHAPSGNVTVDDLARYSEQKAAERKAIALR